MWIVNILTLFPNLYPGHFDTSIMQKSTHEKVWQLNVFNIRDFAYDKHKTVDDKTYGGGYGMLMRADVIANAIDNCFNSNRIVYLSPKGKIFNQTVARNLITNENGINIICGRYEGIDERLFDEYNIEEISMGDYIISCGDIGALSFIDCCVRLLPNVLDKQAIDEETFGSDLYQNLLEYPQYTKPSVWRGHEVPQVLLSGNHEDIRRWRLKQAEKKTKNARPDLWDQYIKGEVK